MEGKGGRKKEGWLVGKALGRLAGVGKGRKGGGKNTEEGKERRREKEEVDVEGNERAGRMEARKGKERRR